MDKQIMVVAPHPDDETLGCGGTLLRHLDEGDHIHWLIVTGMHTGYGFSKEVIKSRDNEIQQVAERYHFSSIHKLNLPTARLDAVEMGELVQKVSQVFQSIQPEVIYLPYRNDAHSDHKVVFDSVISCTKWFRHNYVKRILVYETLSETDFGLNPDQNGFRPNTFVNITDYIDTKIEIMNIYSSEMGLFPFPRSEHAIRSLAAVRGSAAGCRAAEAFMLLKEII